MSLAKARATKLFPPPGPGRVRAGLSDGCGRRIDHLRISLTPACDLRCLYCRPSPEPPRRATRMSWPQRLEFVRFLHERYGLAQVRISGGEPLLCAELVPFVAAIRAALPRVALALTTNGHRLARLARRLRGAGLDRLNVSVDSLDARRYRQITGAALEEVLGGLAAARGAGFPPPKINTVVLRGINDDEVCALARWALTGGSEVRFLEVMPIGPAARFNRQHFVAAGEVHRRLSRCFSLEPLPRSPGATARRYRARGDGCAGVVGLIAPVSEPFCAGCRRVRLTADGRLYPCLLDRQGVDMRAAWREGLFCRATAASLLAAAVAAKQWQGPRRPAAAMSVLGG